MSELKIHISIETTGKQLTIHGNLELFRQFVTSIQGNNNWVDGQKLLPKTAVSQEPNFEEVAHANNN